MHDSLRAKSPCERIGNVTARERRDMPPFDPRETLTMFQLGDEACSILRRGKCLNYLPMIRMPPFQYIDLSATVPPRAANILVNGSDLLQPQDALSKFPEGEMTTFAYQEKSTSRNPSGHLSQSLYQW